MEYALDNKEKELTLLNANLKNDVDELKSKLDNITSVIIKFEQEKQGCAGKYVLLQVHTT